MMVFVNINNMTVFGLKRMYHKEREQLNQRKKYNQNENHSSLQNSKITNNFTQSLNEDNNNIIKKGLLSVPRRLIKNA